MINRIFGSFVMGVAFISILDFLYFIGLKIHYFELNKINEFFNIIFVDNQNFYILLPLSIFVGYLLLYSAFAKVFMKIYIVCILLFLSMLYEPIGKSVGEQTFSIKNQNFQVGSTIFNGDIMYQGRYYIYIYRNDISKTLKLKKDEVIIIPTKI